MGEVPMKVTGLLSNIALLFNSYTFSDVQFVFMSDTGLTQKIFGHKLILALRSKGFASMFYDREESSSEVILPASKHTAFSDLLRFLYTDDVQFHTFEEAYELYELANEYAVEELIDKCSYYMLHETLTIENVFPKYACALRKNMQMPLEDCQDFICSNTELVLESVHFTDASVIVVEDIVKQNNLSVSSELEIISAVLKWGSEELKRKKISPDEKYLRKCIDPFMKHLRFLTLSFSEFDHFIANFNIFTGYESSILTRKIYQPQSVVDFPESLCSITTKRNKKNGSKSMPKVTTESNSVFGSCPQISSPGFSSEKASSVSVLNKMSYDRPPKISQTVSSNSTNTSDISKLKSNMVNAPESPTTCVNKLSYEVKKYSNETNVSQSQLKQIKFCSTPNIADYKNIRSVMNNHFRECEFPLLENQPCLGTSFPKDVKSVLNKMSYDRPPKISQPVSSNFTNTSDISKLKPKMVNVPESPTTHVNKLSYEVKKYSNETNVSQSQLKQIKFCTTPNIADNKYIQSFMNNHRFREYEFPLLESQPCLGTSFPKDVKSTINFKMITGNISLYGVELKVKNNNSRAMEEFEIDIDFRGFSKQSYSHQFKKELKDNVLTLEFPKKMELQEGCKGTLDVSIENLLLNRCNICDINDKGLKLNIGLNFACEISLSSNQKTGNSCIFLISKLIYVPH